MQRKAYFIAIAIIATGCTGPLTMKIGDDKILKGTVAAQSRGGGFEAKNESGTLVCTGKIPFFTLFDSDPVPVTCNDGRIAMISYKSVMTSEFNQAVTYDIGRGKMNDGTVVNVFPGLNYEKFKKNPNLYAAHKFYFKAE